jgi:hypothetical protein
MKKYVLCGLLLAIALFTSVAAQSTERSGLIKTDKGVLVVWNEPGNYYTIEIKGEKITPAEQPLLFQVDGKFFQIQVVDKKAFLNGKNEKDFDDKAILAMHRDWEGDYASGILKEKLKIDSEWMKLPNGKDALAWSYEMPKAMLHGSTSAKRQFYLSITKGSMVFLLNTALTGGDEDKDLKALLFETMSTLKPSDKPLSLQKAAEMVRKGN